MDLTNKTQIHIPADVKEELIEEYKANYLALTRGSDRLFLFSCDQKIEHLNKDFYGDSIHSDDNDPEHLFKIAQHGDVGAFATHLGLITQYGKQYPTINYIVKMNGKTDLIPHAQRDPVSYNLWTIEQIIEFKKRSQLQIRGIGYTIYLGSEYEPQMLAQAAQNIYQAHSHGLIAILWMYPRGKAVKNELAGDLIAGATGIAASLGADFAKINPPKPSDAKTTIDWLAIAAQAAGKTKLIVSGGSKIDEQKFLSELDGYMQSNFIAGTATGRNIHQRSLSNAIALTRSISALIYKK